MTHTAGMLAQIACLMEATARKPGNVHRFTDFADASYLDFALSAQAIGPAMNSARSVGVGQSILAAIEATQQVVSTNTNLGMVVLLAPLSAAFGPGSNLRESTARILQALTINDASHVYQAIRLANPGGLGTADVQDVAEEPTVTLLEAMRLAADRDLVARQYVTNYEDVFDLALPALRDSLNDEYSLESSILHVFLTVLAKHPDSLIARKLGDTEANEVSRLAQIALIEGNLNDFDAYLREDGHARNPGATADLIAATLFVALAEGTITLPRPAGSVGW